jgi:hypothetical protein
MSIHMLLDLIGCHTMMENSSFQLFSMIYYNTYFTMYGKNCWI